MRIRDHFTSSSTLNYLEVLREKHVIHTSNSLIKWAKKGISKARRRQGKIMTQEEQEVEHER